MSDTQTELRNYVATFILDTRDQPDDLDNLFARIRETLESVDCEITEFIDKGRKDFIRVTDRRNPSGVYVEIHFKAPSEAPAAIQEKFRLEKTINRIMIQSA